MHLVVVVDWVSRILDESTLNRTCDLVVVMIEGVFINRKWTAVLDVLGLKEWEKKNLTLRLQQDKEQHQRLPRTNWISRNWGMEQIPIEFGSLADTRLNENGRSELAAIDVRRLLSRTSSVINQWRTFFSSQFIELVLARAIAAWIVDFSSCYRRDLRMCVRDPSEFWAFDTSLVKSVSQWSLAVSIHT